jgi:hypothetical protein
MLVQAVKSLNPLMLCYSQTSCAHELFPLISERCTYNFGLLSLDGNVMEGHVFHAIAQLLVPAFGDRCSRS